MIAHAVYYRDRELHVVGLRELARYPFHGLIGTIAFRFDGRRLELVRLNTLERPTTVARYRA